MTHPSVCGSDFVLQLKYYIKYFKGENNIHLLGFFTCDGHKLSFFFIEICCGKICFITFKIPCKYACVNVVIFFNRIQSKLLQCLKHIVFATNTYVINTASNNQNYSNELHLERYLSCVYFFLLITF